MSSNIVAIVGRPNVGKSTFFNRLIGTRQAIVDNQSGVTRDRQYGASEWNGKQFTVIDTGGFVEGSTDIFEAAIRQQVRLALEEASVVVFVVDAQVGIHPLDEEMARLLQQTDKPVLLMVNKVDNTKLYAEAQEFWGLGFDNLYFVSSVSGSGTGDILDVVVKDMALPDAPLETNLPKVAIIGQPNAGKSTLVNTLLGEERNIVTDIAGTTRDSIYTHYNKFGHEFMLIDTAGIRRKSRVHEDLEFYSVMRAITALEECDICVLLIDATEGLEAQDLNLFRLAKERNKGIVILVNKWDLVEKETNTARDFMATLKERIQPFNDVPILFISALEKQRIHKAVEVIMEVNHNRTKRIPTSELNDFVQDLVKNHPPQADRNKLITIKYVMQIPMYYPAFAFYCNHPKSIKESYRQFLENRLREQFTFTGVSISIFFRDK